MASAEIYTRTFTAIRPMRRNCICVCGTQIRAPINTFKQGVDCPNCGRVILFEEQVDVSTTAPIQGRSSESVTPADLDFNTKEVTLADRIAQVPKWIKILAIFLPPLVALLLLLPQAMEALGLSTEFWRSGPKQTVESPSKIPSIDWSNIQAWNSNIDPDAGGFDGAQIARTFSTSASASKYDQILRLFGYKSIAAEVTAGRKSRGLQRNESREAFERELDQLILGFLQDAESATNGYHDWRAVGVATHNDHKAILIRYYRESLTPVEMLDSEEILLPLTKLITFDNFNLYCDQIFKTKLPERMPNPKLLGYMHTNFFADKNYGYVVLQISGKGNNIEIDDMFDYQTRKPLSRFCMVWTGASTLDVDQVPRMSGSVPGPLDSDLQLIQGWIRHRGDKSRQFNREALRKALKSLHEQTNDPMMLDLMGRLESDEGNKELAFEHFWNAKASHFQSLDSHRYWLQEAMQSQDTELVTQRLHDLNAYWSTKLTGLNADEDRKKYHKFDGYWRRGENL